MRIKHLHYNLYSADKTYWLTWLQATSLRSFFITSCYNRLADAFDTSLSQKQRNSLAPEQRSADSYKHTHYKHELLLFLNVLKINEGLLTNGNSKSKPYLCHHDIWFTLTTVTSERHFTLCWFRQHFPDSAYKCSLPSISQWTSWLSTDLNFRLLIYIFNLSSLRSSPGVMYF